MTDAPLRFEDFILDVARRELRHGTELVPLEPQVFDLLVYVVQNRDRVVSKDDLIQAVWSGRIVSESALTTRINAVRKALGDSGEEQRLVRTVARKGVRFVGTVRVADVDGPTPLQDRGASLPRYPDRPSIAVLPFANVSADLQGEYLADGITDDLIVALGRLHWLFVTARNSSFAYKGSSPQVRQVGRELGVRYLLEGTVRQNGEKVRIGAQVVDTESGGTLWVQRYDRELSDIFELQDSIATSVAAAIEPELVKAEESRLATAGATNIGVWTLLTRAMGPFSRQTVAGYDECMPLLEQALAAEPTNSKALAMLAVATIHRAHQGFDPESDRHFRRGFQLALESFKYDAHDPWAHLALGYGEIAHERHEAAIAAFRRSTELNPSFVLGYRTIGVALAYFGKGPEARSNLDFAVRLSPLDVLNQTIGTSYAMAHVVEGNYSLARAAVEPVIRNRPDFAGAYAMRVLALVGLGEIEAARAAAGDLIRRWPQISLRRTFRFYVEPHQSQIRDLLRMVGIPE